MRKVFKIILFIGVLVVLVFAVFLVYVLYSGGSRESREVKMERVGVAVKFPAGFPSPKFVDQSPELQKLEYRKGYTEGGFWKSSRGNYGLAFRYVQCKPPPDCKLELGELALSLGSKDVELISKENPTIHEIQAVDLTIARKREDKGVQTFMRHLAVPYQGYLFTVIAEVTQIEDLDSRIVGSFFDSLTFPPQSQPPTTNQTNTQPVPAATGTEPNLTQPISNIAPQQIDYCRSLKNITFRSIEKFGTGPPLPDGSSPLGYWSVVFRENDFDWWHGDVVEVGSYTCQNNVLNVKYSRPLQAYYHGSKKILIWDDSGYKRTE